MKEQKSIPVGKVQRASKFISTGAKIGTNYLKHYGKKLVNPNLSKDELHQDNAIDIYKSLSELKGSALKVAQMLSMDKNLLPTAYQQQFSNGTIQCASAFVSVSGAYVREIITEKTSRNF
jgi:predicted unusual protein kinase regulating ubiquinone biosynthesis (AarF/ABC1/UbiB family)